MAPLALRDRLCWIGTLSRYAAFFHSAFIHTVSVHAVSLPAVLVCGIGDASGSAAVRWCEDVVERIIGYLSLRAGAAASGLVAASSLKGVAEVLQRF